MHDCVSLEHMTVHDVIDWVLFKDMFIPILITIFINFILDNLIRERTIEGGKPFGGVGGKFWCNWVSSDQESKEVRRRQNLFMKIDVSREFVNLMVFVRFLILRDSEKKSDVFESWLMKL